jgi:hypothetical protein
MTRERITDVVGCCIRTVRPDGKVMAYLNVPAMWLAQHQPAIGGFIEKPKRGELRYYPPAPPRDHAPICNISCGMPAQGCNCGFV